MDSAARTSTSDQFIAKARLSGNATNQDLGRERISAKLPKAHRAAIAVQQFAIPSVLACE